MVHMQAIWHYVFVTGRALIAADMFVRCLNIGQLAHIFYKIPIIGRTFARGCCPEYFSPYVVHADSGTRGGQFWKPIDRLAQLIKWIEWPSHFAFSIRIWRHTDASGILWDREID